MNTKIALAVGSVLGAALLAAAWYGIADGARFVVRRSAAAIRVIALSFIAVSPIPTRARGQFCIKFGRR